MTLHELLDFNYGVDGENMLRRLLADVAGRNSTQPVELLISAGADLTAPALDSGTPLHQAAWFGQPENARLLLDAGAPVDLLHKKINRNTMESIGRWACFETTIPNSNTYADPYEGVSLNATFQSPDGRTIPFYGFYNGVDWRLRFLPDQLGIWTYHATFSDGTPGVEGQFDCVPSNIPGLISTNASNPIWFGYKNGPPILIRSLHIGDCFFADTPNTLTGAEWNPGMRTAFLDWTQAQGYNLLSIASHYLNRRSEGRGAGWQTPDLWDEENQTPRPAEYARMESILNDLAQRRILVYPFAGFFGRESNHPTNAAKQETFIRYTLARLAPYWNLLFLVGGPEPLLNNKSYLSPKDINRIGCLVRDLDPFDHLRSIHNPTGDDAFRNEDWVSYITLQGPKTVDRKELAEAHLRNHHPEKPLYAQETLWPGNILHSRRIGHDYSPDDIRKNAFVMLFSGATINFADMDGLSSSGFSGRPDLSLKKQAIHDIIHHVWDTFETFPYYRLRPRQDLVDNGYCLASDDGRHILVYFDTPGSLHPNINGQYHGEWINPSHSTVQKEPNAITGETPLRTPDGSDDWILNLTRDEDQNRTKK